MRALILIFAGFILSLAWVPAFAQDAGPKSVSFATEDGGLLFADLYGGGGERGVVLAHGGQFNKESWRPQAERLAAAGFRVLAFDFRGFGKSHGPGDKDFFKAPFELDVLAAVRYLRAQEVTRVAVVGASFGGSAAGAASIASRPGEIDRIVMLGGAPNGDAGKLKCASLFIVAQEDKSGDGELRLPGIREQYAKAPEPKRLIVLNGSAHAQLLFKTDQSERVMKAILQFLNGKLPS